MTVAWLPLPDFQRIRDVPQASVDPAPLAELLREGLVIGDRAVPMFVTAFLHG